MGLFGGNKTPGLTNDAVLTALRGVVDPNVGKDIVTLGLVQGLGIEAGAWCPSALASPGDQPPLARAEIHNRARKAVQAVPRRDRGQGGHRLASRRAATVGPVMPTLKGRAAPRPPRS